MQQTTDSVEPNVEPTTEPRHEVMGGLAKGLAIIEAFAVHDVMSVADAARASGATRAAARRCLLTLNELGYVSATVANFGRWRDFADWAERRRNASGWPGWRSRS